MMLVYVFIIVFFFKQKTAYEMRISDWSSDVCSSDLLGGLDLAQGTIAPFFRVSASVGTTSCVSNSSFSPKPSQVGQAPCGALKEKRRGSISEMVKTLAVQENFSEKPMWLSGMPAFFLLPPSVLWAGPGVGEASGDEVLPHPNTSPAGEGIW